MKNYDLVAKMYDPLLYLFLNPIRKKVMNELQEFKEHSIIDLCCGTGNQLKFLAKNDFKSLHCLDISSSMLDVAKKGEYNINYYNEDATSTPLKMNLSMLRLLALLSTRKIGLPKKGF